MHACRPSVHADWLDARTHAKERTHSSTRARTCPCTSHVSTHPHIHPPARPPTYSPTHPQDGDRFWRMPEVDLRGNTIKYLRVPDEVLDKAREADFRREGE